MSSIHFSGQGVECRCCLFLLLGCCGAANSFNGLLNDKYALYCSSAFRWAKHLLLASDVLYFVPFLKYTENLRKKTTKTHL